MKSLKLDHGLAELVVNGQKTSTWRLFDDKDLSVNDDVRIVDKVDSGRPETWRVVGTARINQVIEKRTDEVTVDEMAEHGYESLDEMVTTFKRYYGNDVSNATTIKIINFTFNNDDKSKLNLNTTLSNKNILLYTDGGSRGNPGPSAAGYCIIDPSTNESLIDKGIYLGVTTNNQAEYLALKLGLETAYKMGARRIEVFMDSMLVVNQMNGVFKIKNRDLWPVHDAIVRLAASFERVSYAHIPREQNHLADAAVNRALDEQQAAADAA